MASDLKKAERHAEAQRRYREKNLETTREKARERMRWKRASRSVEELAAAPEKRREADANYNEYKFVQKFGHRQFMEHYFPLYAERGTKHLPGLKFQDRTRERKKHIRAHQRK
ncbi:hypothetical protein K438DRAFT_1786194 [Mycena galopus ATCC 62051]|nr:hypothetical protein K438DRAFT_1786194 [Mycena galopus ATCC 62051]